MSERSLRQSYHAIIRAVAAADEDALDRLIAEDMVDHNAVPGQAPGDPRKPTYRGNYGFILD